MRLLVIFCHPVDDSFCAALHGAALETLRRGGHEIRDRDLYAEGFEPVLTRDERISYHTRGDNTRGVESHLADLDWAEGLVFVYPTWWYGLPAMLKGWLDRVWVPHVTFSMPEGGRPIRPLMQHLRMIVGISTYGAPWWWVKMMHDPGRTTLTRGLGALFHPRCKRVWLAHYQIDRSTDASRAAFIERVRRRLARL